MLHTLPDNIFGQKLSFRQNGPKIKTRKTQDSANSGSPTMKIFSHQRIDSPESPRFALRIAQPSKVRTTSLCHVDLRKF